MKWTIVTGLLLINLFFSLSISASQYTLLYPSQNALVNQQASYPLELLKLALSYSEDSYTLETNRGPVVSQEQALANLARGSGVDVMWMMTSSDRELSARPIRVPIYKGLMGYRLSFIHKAYTKDLASVRDIGGLRKLTAGQGSDWPDSKILEANQLSVIKSNYMSLFKMMTAGRFTYFPRSIAEIWLEYDGAVSSGNIALAVDPSIIIKYPTASYFFVHPKNTHLAEVLESGLEASIQDGRFDELFFRHHREMIRRSKLEDRVLIELDNPFLPEKTPLNREELWYRGALDERD